MSGSQVELMRELHDEHAAALWSYCVRLTGNDTFRAEDTVQETLLRAWRHPNVLDRPPGQVRAWLFTVARNIAIDEWRVRRTHPETPTAEPPDQVSDIDHTDQLLLSWMVSDAFTRLSADHRAVLVACYYRGYSTADAAQRLGIPVGTVKSRTHYALRALRLALEEMGVGREL